MYYFLAIWFAVMLLLLILITVFSIKTIECRRRMGEDIDEVNKVLDRILANKYSRS